MEDVRAWELLHDPDVAGRLDAEGYYELCKAAGFPEDEAQRAASERAWQRLRKDLPP
jgi:hypothetical protein